MESTMFFDSGMAVDLAQRAVYIAHIPVCGQTKKTPKGVFFVCPVLHTAGWALLSFYIRITVKHYDFTASLLQRRRPA